MNIHLFSFIRNEAYLLRKWIPYHASITGIQNIHVIDHKSDDPECIALLNKYKARGLDVVRTSKSFKIKYKLLTQLMHKHKSEADILIPIDADEFLCLAEPEETLNADCHSIRRHLNSLPINGKKYSFNVYEAVPGQPDYDDPLLEMNRFTFFEASETASGPNQQTKTFFPAKNFSYTDQGNHKGGVLLAPNNLYNTSKMAIAHFHIQGFRHFMEKLGKAIDAYQLENLPPDYEGTGMRWNGWYHETKDLDDLQKKKWFGKNFIKTDKGTKQTALAEAFKSLPPN